MMPTADEVAIAIITASKETGADPIAVASGVKDGIGPKPDHAVSRARAYAAYAIYKAFGCDPISVSRMVGAGTPQSYLFTFMNRLNKGLTWWNQGIADRVRNAIDQYKTMTPRQPEAPITRPFASERQANAYRELQRAIQNTAQLKTNSQQGE